MFRNRHQYIGFFFFFNINFLSSFNIFLFASYFFLKINRIYFLYSLCENGVHNTSSVTKSSNSENPVDNSQDAKLVSKIRSDNLKNYANTTIREIETEETRELRKGRARSAPEIRLTEMQPSSSAIIWAESSMNT